MSKSLVVFYSLEGNVEFVAKEIAKNLGADLLKLETVKEYPKKGLLKYFHGGKDAISNSAPELKTQIPDLSGYELFVIGTPVWAGRAAAPINTFLNAADFSGKKVAAFCSSASGNAGKTFESIESKAKNAKLCETLSLKNPLRNAQTILDEINAFSEKLK